ncbi:hypothetical protein ACFOY2_02265 [Nonomuraea purpurea]|uniref:Uncharacterized protein n=1 Tax=Nonomuraea purpurea TaxID=1849276 RepID=A0ABV8G1A2_9ACTN
MVFLLKAKQDGGQVSGIRMQRDVVGGEPRLLDGGVRAGVVEMEDAIAPQRVNYMFGDGRQVSLIDLIREAALPMSPSQDMFFATQLDAFRAEDQLIASRRDEFAPVLVGREFHRRTGSALRR